MRANRPHPTNGDRSEPLLATASVEQSWPVWARVLVSLFLAFHLAALLIGCLAAPPCSAIETKVYTFLRPYCNLIDQGVSYRYYSRLEMTTDPTHPRPWSTPIILAEMEFDSPDGSSRRETLRIPDSEPIWPRLRHQRRIDLAFHLTSDPRWAASYARHLCQSRQCERVTLFTQTHTIPDLKRIRAATSPLTALSLDPVDGSTYGPRVKLGEFQCADFSEN